MTYSRSSSRSSSDAGREEDRFRDIGAAASAMIALFFVLLSVFVYIARLDLTQMAKSSDPAADPATAEDPLYTATRAEDAGGEGGVDMSKTEDALGDEASTEAFAGEVAPAVVPDAMPDSMPEAMPGSDTIDPSALRQALAARGYQIRFPAGWRAASVEEATPPLSAADHDLVLEAPSSGARIAVSSWDATDLVPLVLWAPTVAEGMRPVDGRWATNAVLAGEPAMILWAQESPITPARYAAFVGHSGRYYRLAYSALDGGEALNDYAQLLNSLRWSDAAQANDAGDRLPPMPLPRPRYHPSERLFAPGAPSN